MSWKAMLAGALASLAIGADHAVAAPSASSVAEARLGSLAAVARRSPVRYRDYSPAGFAAEMGRARHILEVLKRIDRPALPYNQQTTYDMIAWDAQTALARAPFGLLQFPYTPYEFNFHGPNRVLTGFEFHRDADAEAYLRLAAAYPAAIASIQVQVDAQAKAGVRLQRDVAAKVQGLLAGQAEPAEESFAWPKGGRLSALSPRAARVLRERLRPIIEGQINPSIRSLADRFGAAYQAKAPTRYGLAQYHGGKAYYALLVREQLTLDTTPEHLFEESQAALDRLESELRELRAEMGYAGSREAFDARLNRDPRFIAKTPAEVERTYLGYMGRIDPLMPRLFCRRAGFGYAVERAPAAQEAALTFGYSDVDPGPPPRGVYFYNGSNLDQRSLLTAQALIYHELAPGHYYEAAVHALVPPTSEYPRNNMAFGEAWGDFAQLIAYEQGLFRTPEERYGRLLFLAMFRARALADIGVNYYGRDFEWGLKILRRYTSESDLQNRASLARDTTDWQAHILPYSFGSEEILRLREKTRAELGDRFDEPRFYDAILTPGALPFPVLERRLDWFVAQEKTGRASGICDG